MNKNHLISLATILLFASITHPQHDEPSASKDSTIIRTPQKVHRFCYTIEPKDWYENQERLWKAETINNPRDEEAWRNFYFAARYARMGTDEAERTKILRSIVDKIGVNIPDSYLYSYLQYYNGDRNVEYLEKAYQLKPDCADLYWEFIQYYELNGIKSKKRNSAKNYISAKT